MGIVEIHVPGEQAQVIEVEVPGIRGASAYEVAVENGFEGTEQEWLDSLQGVDGRSIVSIDRTEGDGAPGTTDTYTITYDDETTSTFQVTHGTDGQNGLSAYELALADGFEGTIEEWLASLDGQAGSDGRGIVSIERTEGDGSPGTTDTYTITYTDETTSTFQVTHGTDGIDGDDGLSAYELAVQEGFEGTLEEWLESLRGEDGDDAKGLFRGEWVDTSVVVVEQTWEDETLPEGATYDREPAFVTREDPTSFTTKALRVGEKGVLGHNQSCYVEWDISYAGGDPIVIRYAISSEISDKGRIYVDGVEQLAAGGTSGTWSTKTITGIEPGTRTLRFSYSKDSSVTQGDDCLYVGKITYPSPDFTFEPYMAGEFVVHEGKLWRSTSDENAGTPGVDGTWEEVPLGPELATVATSGSYNDLTDKPTLGTAAAADVEDFATAQQGGKADSAVQPEDLTAESTSYDNTDSGLTATDVQGAIDEVAARADSTGTYLLEAEEDESDVPPETPIGTIIFRKGS